MIHVLDTSVLTRFDVDAVQKRIDELSRGEIGRTVMTDLELGHSARTAEEWDAVAGTLTGYTKLLLSPEVTDRAQAVQRTLADRGLRGRTVPDLLIAAAAELAGGVLLHYDKDFEHIASVTGQPHEWVVERGSID
jgi:predicted nucleic acid-binding protein